MGTRDGHAPPAQLGGRTVLARRQPALANMNPRWNQVTCWAVFRSYKHKHYAVYPLWSSTREHLVKRDEDSIVVLPINWEIIPLQSEHDG